MQSLDLRESVVEATIESHGDSDRTLRVALSPLRGCEKVVDRR